MRPVNRGTAPNHYSKYGDAIGDLEDQLGNYCNFCEERFRVGLEVEHVSPKSKDGARKTDWDNFLLACKICNTVKGKKPTNDEDFLWPDKDNTLRAISYTDGGLVNVAGALPEAIHAKAENLINLVGLDRHPGQPREKRPTKRDKRYKARNEVWALACLKKNAIAHEDSLGLRDAVADLAKAEGFFGVWMTVFSDDKDMRERIIARYDKGTALNCFGMDYELLQRPGGRI